MGSCLQAYHQYDGYIPWETHWKRVYTSELVGLLWLDLVQLSCEKTTYWCMSAYEGLSASYECSKIIIQTVISACLLGAIEIFLKESQMILNKLICESDDHFDAGFDSPPLSVLWIRIKQTHKITKYLRHSKTSDKLYNCVN